MCVYNITRDHNLGTYFYVPFNKKILRDFRIFSSRAENKIAVMKTQRKVNNKLKTETFISNGFHEHKK